jgi:hypothetical protein
MKNFKKLLFIFYFNMILLKLTKKIINKIVKNNLNLNNFHKIYIKPIN